MKENQIVPETIQKLSFRSGLFCLRPGGNDTALVTTDVVDPLLKKKINDSIMNIFPNIEQVGFVSVRAGQLNLNMAGGEFCGNATRSSAYLALAGQPGDLKIKVSGVENLLSAGVTQNGEAYAQMPIFSDSKKVQKDTQASSAWVVIMQGITHYIDFDSAKIEGLSTEDIKKLSWSTIKEKGLDIFPASGVIYVKKLKEGLQIIPVVYVKEIDTLFLETACGSGTCALGQVLTVKDQRSVFELPVTQPSGEVIKISVIDDDGQLKYAQIQGPIRQLSEGVIKTDKKGNFYIVEKLNLVGFQNEQTRQALIDLYKEIFKDKPYYEVFTDEEVIDYFNEYLQQGSVLLARNREGIIGFAAVLPLKTQKEIIDLAKQFGIDPEKSLYIAELGVQKKNRKKQIGQSLIEELLMQIPSNLEVILRTTKLNFPAIGLYKKLGFQVVDGFEERIKRTRTSGKNPEDQRIFLIKSL